MAISSYLLLKKESEEEKSGYMRNSLTPQKESEQEKTVLLTSLLSLSSCMSSVQVSVSRIWAAMA